MGLLARQVAPVAAEKGLASQSSPLGPLITALGRHAFLQQFSEEPRNAGIVTRRLDPDPQRDFFFQSDGYISQSRG